MLRLVLLPIITLFLGFLSGLDESPPEANAVAYPEHLTGAFTGGFGEQTCRSCHFDYDLNPEEGSLSVSGIPSDLSGGEVLEIEIAVQREELGRAGFQLSARYADGSQAGKFAIDDDSSLMLSNTVPDSLQYIQHSNKGSEPRAENKTSWTVTWKAPKSLTGPVIFNIAANAANGDQSEFGDFIFAEEIQVGF